MDLLDKLMGKDEPPSAPSPTQMGRIPKRVNKEDEPSAPTPKKERPGPSSGYSMKRERDTFEAVETLPVQVNMFDIDITRTGPIDRIHVDIVISSAKGKTKDMNVDACGTGDLSLQYKRTGLWTLWKALVVKHKNLFRMKDHSCGAYNAANIIYFPQGLYTGGATEVAEFTKEDFSETEWQDIAKMARIQIAKISVTLKRTTVVHTSGRESLDADNRQELVHALEVITSQEISSADFFTFKNATYARKQNATACQGDPSKEIKCGFEKAMRLIEGKNDTPKVVMTIDVRRSPFYVQMSVLKFMTIIVDKAENRGGGGGGGFNGRGRDNGGFRGRDNRGGYGSKSCVRGDDRRSDYRDRSYAPDNRRRDDRDRYDDRRRDDYDDRRRDRYDDRRGGRDDYGGRHDDRGKDVSKDFDKDKVENIARRYQSSSNKRRCLNLDELCGLAVTATHLKAENQKAFFISKFDFNGAKNKTFQLEDSNGTREVSIYDYYIERYGIRLEYPDLPLAVQRKGKAMCHYPLELLVIEDGQRVRPKNIGAELQRQMTGNMTLKPADHVRDCFSTLERTLKIDRRNKYLAAFNISVDSSSLQTLKIEARQLPPPEIFFDNDRYTPDMKNVQFGMKNNKFIKAASLKSVLFIEIQCKGNFSFRDSLKDFRRDFDNHCSQRGIHFRTRPSDWDVLSCRSTDIELLENMIKAAKDNVDCVIAVCNDKKPECHDDIKLFEEKYGVQTLQLDYGTIQKMMGHGSAQTVNNVIRKFNLKCGGTNFHVEVASKYRSKIFCPNKMEIQKKLFEDTLFVGFEISHGGGVCAFDRQNNIVRGDPSVVGVSYSMKNSCELGGFNYLQSPREYSLRNLDVHFPLILENYYKKAKCLPKKIVVYRVGTGEGDYPKVQDEIRQMRKIANESPKIQQLSPKGYRPEFVVIVVQKNSHYRIFRAQIPNSPKAIEQNVPSGTCLDSVITAHGYDEFILVSQIAMIGTVRPIRYTIMTNDCGWTRNEVSHMTYYLAFGHQVSYQPPAVPAVLYGAENMAKRGRNNLKAHQRLMRLQYDNDNNSNMSGHTDEGVVADDKKIDELSNLINRCTLHGKMFWA